MGGASGWTQSPNKIWSSPLNLLANFKQESRTLNTVASRGTTSSGQEPPTSFEAGAMVGPALKYCLGKGNATKLDGWALDMGRLRSRPKLGWPSPNPRSTGGGGRRRTHSTFCYRWISPSKSGHFCLQTLNFVVLELKIMKSVTAASRSIFRISHVMASAISSFSDRCSFTILSLEARSWNLPRRLLVVRSVLTI